MKRHCHHGRVKSGPRKGRCRKVARRMGGGLLGKAAHRCKGTGRRFRSCVRGEIRLIKRLR